MALVHRIGRQLTPHNAADLATIQSAREKHPNPRVRTRLTVLWYKHSLGFRWRKAAAIPLPPKKTLDEQIAIQANYLKHTLLPLLGDAQAGRRLVFFVDAAHFVLGVAKQ